MQIFSKDKLFLLFFATLFLVLGLRVFSDTVLNKDKRVETTAVIVSKYRFDSRGYKGYRTNKTRYRIAYIYEYDRDVALEYNNKDSLDRRLNFHKESRNAKRFETSKYAAQIDNSSVILETRPLDLQTYRSLTVGQEIVIKYRQDIPWRSEVTYWSAPSR